MAEVIKIVLTGGPCGGKTTALNFLKDELEKLNFFFLLNFFFYK